MRPDFYVIGPARPADPHIELEFLNHRVYPELSIYTGLKWDGALDPTIDRVVPPYFRGTEGAFFLPDIICNDHGLPLWKPSLVARMLAVEPFIPLCLIDANIGVRGGRKPLRDGAKIVMPAVRYGHEVIDWDETIRRYPKWADEKMRRGLRPPEILLRKDFRPSAPLFTLGFLQREQIVLNQKLGAAICGPEADVPLKHCHAERISEIGYEQSANCDPTPPDQYDALLAEQVQLAKAKPRKKVEPMALKSPNMRREPIDDPVVRAKIMSLFREQKQQPLSGNRESWSELLMVDGNYYLRSGLTDEPGVSTTRISEDDAWIRLRERAMEGLGLYTFAEQATAQPAAILDYFMDIWRKRP